MGSFLRLQSARKLKIAFEPEKYIEPRSRFYSTEKAKGKLDLAISTAFSLKYICKNVWNIRWCAKSDDEYDGHHDEF